MPFDVVPWWVWIPVLLGRLVAGVCVRLYTAVTYRRAAGRWPPPQHWWAAPGSWSIQINIERRR